MSIMDSYTLKSVSDLPAPFRSVFSFRYFNSLQSECFPVCFHSDVNMVISAPTGSGKTVLFELCILRLLSRFISEGRFIHIKGTLKTIYTAPSKALVQEKLRDWNQKFGSWGINCLELTGDNEFYNIKTVQEADIILTTPEKFDAVTRYRIKDGGLSFFSDIALLLIDEVHLLSDPRGAALEAIVSRIKMLSRNPEMNSSPLSSVRLLAVSATIPNIEDIAEWLDVPVQGIKRFGEEMRPVKLTTKVFGYTPAKNDFLFEKRLQNYIFDILMQFSRGQSALVFCSTRKGAQEAAQRLSQIAMTFGYSNPFIKDKEQQERLREASLSFSDKQMQSYIIYGVGYHNGGLCLKDRSLVENLFLKGDIQVLCTTNTLAHGINLPAHTVVIKSTQHFNKEKGLYMEYDRSTILQMCGRAGRPPFDDTGMVIIMTRRETVHLYENLLNGCEMVESQLLPCVTEHLTAEVVQLTVSDVARAIEWMKCSFLYVRMKKNPEKYEIKGISKDRIEKHVQEISIQKINELSRHQMIWNGEDAFLLKPLEPGRLMTKYYLKFDTMKHIMQTPENCSLEDALNVICRAEELAWIQLRRNEKKLLNDINIDKGSRLRFHVNGDKGKRKRRIQSREEKIFVLANDCLTGDPSVRDLSLTQDLNSICSNGSRIAKCMKEYFIFKKNYRGAMNSILLAKSLYQKLWDDSPYLLKQLSGIGMVTAKALHSMGIKSFDALAEADPRRIEIVTGRKFPFGNHIKDSLLSLPPKVNISIEETVCRRQGKSKLLVTLSRLSQPIQSAKRHYADMIVGAEEDNLIHFHEKIRVDEFTSPYKATILLSIPQKHKLTVKADLIFEEYIGLDLHEKRVLIKDNSLDMNYNRGLRQPSYFPPPQKVFVIEDDNEIPSYPSDGKTCNLTKSGAQNNSMPSFELLNEELGEDDHAVEMNADNCRILSEQEIFDHIREKAKNFPLFTPLRTACSPLTEAIVFKRKHRREKDLELDVIEVSEGSGISQHFPNLTSDIRESKRSVHINNYLHPKHVTAAGNLVTSNVKNDKGEHISQSETSQVKRLTEETTFSHIREKADNFPGLTRTLQTGSSILTRELLSEDQTELRNATIVSDLEPGGTVMNGCGKAKENEFTYETNESWSIPWKVSSTNDDPSSVQILSYDISMVKDNTRTQNSGRSDEYSSKKNYSPNGAKRQCCSLAMDPFIGFESVFSFL
ncbi:DExH-box ATP-dependent RNA helicase DExH17 isoform X1 [Euphorbia lathyris]|uniref:DExH-box ATP-dependent RNA helicase DExH17 isoform X1 n=1 Tax=Euphorbia lathyris TaxID=212925 RepID=UPI0033143345